MQRKRMIDTKIHQVHEHLSLQSFLGSRTIPAGITTIYSGGLPIDLLIHPADSKTTVVFFHGAIEDSFVLPVLTGLGISSDLNANRIFVSDPSLILDKGLLLSWYAGNHKQPDLQKTLRRVLRKITRSLKTKNLVFFGGSGGGFAALYFASHFQNSTAVIFNPQTNIARYSPRAVQGYTQRAFLLNSEYPAPLHKLPANITQDLCAHYRTRRSTRIAYVQNLNDESHLHSHLQPFIEEAHPKTKLYLLTDSWGPGHSPPPKDLLYQLLVDVVGSRDWTKGHLELGFKMPALGK